MKRGGGHPVTINWMEREPHGYASIRTTCAFELGLSLQDGTG